MTLDLDDLNSCFGKLRSTASKSTGILKRTFGTMRQRVKI